MGKRGVLGACAGLLLASAAQAGNVEMVEFPGTGWRPVEVVRGSPPVSERAAQPRSTVEVVSFVSPRNLNVTIVRGAVSVSPATDPLFFGPASSAQLDQIAFAIDGAESSHGADPRMWRPEPSGPQGPMQVTAAAAFDIGGGDRFDLAQNRALGRAYLDRLFRRYGNWPDAVAAYNWGPGNLDAWITAGRPADRFPLEIERYRDRVLRDAASLPNQ